MAQTKGEVMHLAELKQKTIADLNDVARDLKIEGAANLRKQELIFAILQAQTEKKGVVFGEGVLESRTGSDFCGPPTPTIFPVQTTSTFLPRRSAGSTFARGISFRVKSDRPRKASAISPF
jgi:hypothetical protein